MLARVHCVICQGIWYQFRRVLMVFYFVFFCAGFSFMTLLSLLLLPMYPSEFCSVESRNHMGPVTFTFQGRFNLIKFHLLSPHP